MRKLAVAETCGAIEPTFVDAYSRGRPGFQIAPRVSTSLSVAILQEHMRTTLGMSEFTFNVAFGTTRPQGIEDIRHFYEKQGDNDSGPHIDETQPRRQLGIVLHHNVQGVGRVMLQLAKPGVTELMELEHEGISHPVIQRGDVASPKYEGELEPGMKTVFFEGFTAVSGLVAVTMGASIHDFQSEGAYRQWTRYSWEPMAEVA